MKVYFIDKAGKKLELKKLIEEEGIGMIEHKDTYSFRATKNDIIILSDYDPKEDYTVLKKFNNLIIIIPKNDVVLMAKLANEYHVLDIIYAECEDSYIAHRIARLIM